MTAHSIMYSFTIYIPFIKQFHLHLCTKKVLLQLQSSRQINILQEGISFLLLVLQVTSLKERVTENTVGVLYICRRNETNIPLHCCTNLGLV